MKRNSRVPVLAANQNSGSSAPCRAGIRKTAAKRKNTTATTGRVNPSRRRTGFSPWYKLIAPASRNTIPGTYFDPADAGHSGNHPPRNNVVVMAQTVIMAEYSNMITVCAITTTLFLGGWLPLWPASAGSKYVPGIVFLLAGAISLYHGLNPVRRRDGFTLPVVAVVFFLLAAVFLIPALQGALLPLFWFAAKTGTLLLLFIWIRGTLPRFRYDQLMAFAWKFMFPVAVLNLLVTGLLVAMFS